MSKIASCEGDEDFSVSSAGSAAARLGEIGAEREMPAAVRVGAGFSARSIASGVLSRAAGI